MHQKIELDTVQKYGEIPQNPELQPMQELLHSYHSRIQDPRRLAAGFEIKQHPLLALLPKLCRRSPASPRLLTASGAHPVEAKSLIEAHRLVLRQAHPAPHGSIL